MIAQYDCSVTSVIPSDFMLETQQINVYGNNKKAQNFAFGFNQRYKELLFFSTSSVEISLTGNSVDCLCLIGGWGAVKSSRLLVRNPKTKKILPMFPFKTLLKRCSLFLCFCQQIIRIFWINLKILDNSIMCLS